jgi:hypothetical protein
LWDMYLYLITLKQNNSTLVFALILSFGENMCQHFLHTILCHIKSEVTFKVRCVSPCSNYFSFCFVTPIRLMVIRSNMVTVFKLKHPCIRCCAKKTLSLWKGQTARKAFGHKLFCQSSWNCTC